MRSLLFLITLALAHLGFAFSVKRYDMAKFKVVFKHYRGGIKLEEAKRRLKAVEVMPAGFFAKRFGMYHAIDLLIDDRKMVVGDIFKQKVMTVHADGKVRIFPSYIDSLNYGQPIYAAAGKNIPPEPSRKCLRQMWAVKGKYFFIVKLKGSAKSCLRIAKKWGFEYTIFFDGGSTLVNEFTPAVAGVLKI
ncbi:hypothetical protein HY844_01290 [Candidatus Berkelbacteria bacterium]|nr:hypothetical protein [Candidatus Berkelbacteria bacterium]